MAILDLLKRKHSLMSAGILQGLKDCHSHILFGVDDGLKTLEESLEVLDFLEKAGVGELWCTPHIMEDSPNTTDHLKERFSELQMAYKGEIHLQLAAEYMLDTLFEERFKSRDLLTLKDNTLLVETSTWNPPPALYETLSELQKAGYRPLFAHPERYRYLNEPSYERLHKMGLHFQLNLGSLVGYYGETAQRKALWLLQKGWYSAAGSDCHRFQSLNEQLCRKVVSKETIERLNIIK